MPENYLIVSDTQIPFHAPRALEFVKYLRKTFKVPPENCYHVGDELDQYFGSLYKKHPDMKYSATGELKASIDELKRWYDAFPKMKLATSNHGLRWVSKFVEAEIPTQLLRPYREIIQAPDGWQWKDEWIVKAERMHFRIIHGTPYSGKDGHLNACLDAGVSTAIGHLHSFAAVNHVHLNTGKRLWAMNVGSLINEAELAFHYSRNHRRLAVCGAGVVLNGGTMPVFVPYS